MAYLPDDLPLPRTDEIDTAAWWEKIANNEFVVQQCDDCGIYRNPPAPLCNECLSFNHHLEPVPNATGKIYSYTICYHPVHAALREWPPYNVAIIELDDVSQGTGLGGVRFVGNIIDAEHEDLHVGMAVKQTFEERGGVNLVQWLKA